VNLSVVRGCLTALAPHVSWQFQWREWPRENAAPGIGVVTFLTGLWRLTVMPAADWPGRR
jgi:hypothetical protein